MRYVLALAALLFATQSLASTSFSSTDPLLAIDLNRSAIIADIVRSFEAKAGSQESTKLRERLEKLRADRLLAASLASSRASLDSILAEADSPQPTAFASAGEKALGDANRDLVYTPIVPCPIVNTYNSPIGRLPAASTTAFDAIAGDFSAQGGQNSCATQLPANTAAIAAQIAVVSPSNEGWLNLWPVGQTIPNNVTLGYYRNQVGDMPNIVTNSAIVPLCTSGCAGGKEFNLYTASEAVVTISVVGYFAPPLGGAPGVGTVTSVATGTGLTGGPVTTTGTISLATGGVGTTQLADGSVTSAKLANSGVGTTQLANGSVTSAKLASSGCSAGQILKYSGTAWACAADVNSGGTVTGVTASAPLASSGGIAPNISLAGGVAGQVLAGTSGAPAWTGSPSLTGNITLVESTASAGNILKGSGNRFLHNFGTNNTFVGESAGNFTMSGFFNTATGFQALILNDAGYNNTATGDRALGYNTDGNMNTAVGGRALQNNSTGDHNVAIGSYALVNNTTASANTAVGSGALQVNSIGSDNVAIGWYALLSNTTASANTAVGSEALRLQSYNNGGTVWSSLNTAVGYRALYSNQPTSSGYGKLNTAIGANSLDANTTGYSNTATGANALSSSVSGVANTAVGWQALQTSTGSWNTAIGYSAGFSLTTGDDNLYLNNYGSASESNTARIGGTYIYRTFIAGVRGVTTGSANAVNVLIDSAGQLGTVSSSRRVKDDITDMDSASSALMKLRPVTFHYKSDKNPSGRTLQYGLIAEEVAEVYPGLVAHSEDGQVETVMYQFLPSMLLNEYQKQQRTIEAQAKHIEEMERTYTAEVAGLKQAVAKVTELEERMARMARLLDQQRAGTVTAGLLK